MEINQKLPLLLLQITFLLTLLSNISLSLAADDDNAEPNGTQTYLVWVQRPASLQTSAQSHQDLDTWYQSFLPESNIASSNSLKKERIVHAYRNVATGFAARLTAEEVMAMEKKEGFVSAKPEKILPLHTTHSASFLGLNRWAGLWKGSNYGKGTIIGVMDSGIVPDLASFHDAGMPPPPPKWKGACTFNKTLCNNKIIGARNFAVDEESPLDTQGHGSHTASTAAGNFVRGASVLGLAKGTAVGMAPHAHLAIYKVCMFIGCRESDILAGMDAAVEDGVDVISISLGGGAREFYSDVVAIAAFAAIQKGIFVSCSAGNSGPFYFSTANEAPWILTVGASTMDRSLRTVASLGNSKSFFGESLFQPKNFTSNSRLPLVYPGAHGNISSANCEEGCIGDVKGKIVLCESGTGRIAPGQEVKRAGGAAMILMNLMDDGYTTTADPHVLPVAHVSYAAGEQIKAYINSTTNPTATIMFKGTVIGDRHAPSVASFSSRGPCSASPGILKPDIIGPGVSILAAWPDKNLQTETSKASFNIISGTSMSCPHLSGIAALLKSSHPDWSPAAIKSAIMTTAHVHNLGGKSIENQISQPADIFAIGAGHVNPSRANDPGLIYDLHPTDYFPYLCGLNYTEKEIQLITQTPVNCSEVGIIPEAQLNYPSFSIRIMENQNGTLQNYTRTVKNVGPANSSYKVDITVPDKMNVIVSPTVLKFTKVNQSMSYHVKFIPRKGAVKDDEVAISQGYLRWVSYTHIVTSPIAVLLGGK